MSKKSFLKGAAILGITSMLVRVIGIVYRIPLANILGDEGLGLYQTAYPFYTTLLMLSTAGLPPSISKLVAEKVSKGDHAGARKVFRVSLALLGLLGLSFSVIMYTFSARIAEYVGDPMSYKAIATISPALFIVSLISCIRGYFQGLQNMKPTALSQLVEQVGKVILGLVIASTQIHKGIEYGAAGAVLGVVISEALALCFIIIYYIFMRPEIKHRSKDHESASHILKRLGRLAFPILLGASVMPLMTATDTIIIRKELMSVGYTIEQSRALFGMFSGRVNTLFNVPGSLSLALCVSMVPAISSALARHDKRGIQQNVVQGYKMATLVGIPSSVGLAVLATPIMNLLYGSTMSADAITLSGNLLQIMAGGVLFLSILQTFNGVLQGLGKVMIPVIALAAGAIVKVVVNLTLISIPSINIYGAPIGTFLCYFIAAIIDIIMVKRYTGVKLSFGKYLLKPLIASVIMGAAAWDTYQILAQFLGLNHKIATLIAVFVGMFLFAICIPILRILTRDEFLGIPGGSRFVKYYDALSLKRGSNHGNHHHRRPRP